MNQIDVEPGIFHIHIDAQRLPADLHRFAVQQLGFADTNFSGHPPGFAHFEPKCHLTLKLHAKSAFDAAWSRLETAAHDTDFVGYLEGEYILTDELIAYRPYRNLDVPFQIERRRLAGTRGETFRQSELHLAYRRDGSDERLGEKLLQAGLFGAFIPKEDGAYLVLTCQGFIRDIKPLHGMLRRFVTDSGGAWRCTLKEERAIKHQLIGVGSHELPEIVQRVDYRDSH